MKRLVLAILSFLLGSVSLAAQTCPITIDRIDPRTQTPFAAGIKATPPYLRIHYHNHTDEEIARVVFLVHFATGDVQFSAIHPVPPNTGQIFTWRDGAFISQYGDALKLKVDIDRIYLADGSIWTDNGSHLCQKAYDVAALAPPPPPVIVPKPTRQEASLNSLTPFVARKFVLQPQKLPGGKSTDPQSFFVFPSTHGAIPQGAAPANSSSSETVQQKPTAVSSLQAVPVEVPVAAPVAEPVAAALVVPVAAPPVAAPAKKVLVDAVVAKPSEVRGVPPAPLAPRNTPPPYSAPVSTVYREDITSAAVISKYASNKKVSLCSVSSEPSGASVSLDGQRLGVTPLRFVLVKPNVAQQIVVSMPGYHAVNYEIYPDGGSFPLSIHLVKEDDVVQDQ